MNYDDLTNITDEDVSKLKAVFFKKPSIEDVEKELIKIKNKGQRVFNIDRYYFFDLRCDTVINGSGEGISVNSLFKDKELLLKYIQRAMKYYAKYVDYNKDFYNNVKDALSWHFRVKGACECNNVSIPSRFSRKTARNIYEKYNTNNVMYDPCAGWGDRLLAALSMNIDYIATDTNEELVDRLNKLGAHYNSVNNTQNKYNIVCGPAEKYMPELENKVGLVFTSPPYFDLEIYKGDETSTKLYNEYDSWKNNFLRNMLDNSYRYLVNGGYICINIKNSRKYPLYEDTKQIMKENPGLKFVSDEKIKVVSRFAKKHSDDYMDEKCCVFQKMMI